MREDEHVERNNEGTILITPVGLTVVQAYSVLPGSLIPEAVNDLPTETSLHL